MGGAVVLLTLFHGTRRAMNIGGITFPLEQQSKDEESVVYHGQYDTEGVPHTKSGDRQPVQVSIEVSEYNYPSLICMHTFVRINGQRKCKTAIPLIFLTFCKRFGHTYSSNGHR